MAETIFCLLHLLLWCLGSILFETRCWCWQQQQLLFYFTLVIPELQIWGTAEPQSNQSDSASRSNLGQI